MFITLGLNPVPAARPKHGRGKVYYPKTYSRFKAAAARLLPGLALAEGMAAPADCPLYVHLVFVARRPKHTILDYPLPDIDNFCKAALDAGNGILWEDDKQIIHLMATKEWTTDHNEEGYIEYTIEEAE